ncbi:hypothetical protein H257_07506 [Aphanomyces astaci]|uniref:Uncharacterized protein n=1 Tax=Aphanomyces astaci TaxID=112090 RepID=W4GJK0_APHAT|nr:hypothetical protein H257_07506 [Aphanomyces astaci]ETV79516.1 hypothetical protein H257_07506 [Aphanomyces astaci]|eukprot:XP_009831357.1 hypothetical protein H257_07506 [Aphanomyces astaci]
MQGKASGKGAAVKTESKVKGFHWDRSRIFTPAGWGGVDLGYVLDVTRCLTVVGAFDETRDDWGYQTANAAGVEHLRLFASAQSFELRVLWLLLAVECMHLARVSFHRFDEFKGAMRELHERDRLERWTMNVGWIELCNDETLFEYLVAFLWALVGQGSGRHGHSPLTAGRLANSLSNFARVWRQKHGRLDARSVARIATRINVRCEPELTRPVAVHRNPTIALAWAFEIAWAIGGPAAAQVQGARLPASAWSSVWASPTASSSTLAREDAQVAARLSAARPVNPFAGYNPPLGPQQDGQVTEAEPQAAADYRAGARAVAAPQQVLGPMSRTATPGAPGEEEKSMAAEEEKAAAGSRGSFAVASSVVDVDNGGK